MSRPREEVSRQMGSVLYVWPFLVLSWGVGLACLPAWRSRSPLGFNGHEGLASYLGRWIGRREVSLFPLGCLSFVSGSSLRVLAGADSVVLGDGPVACRISHQLTPKAKDFLNSFFQVANRGDHRSEVGAIANGGEFNRSLFEESWTCPLRNTLGDSRFRKTWLKEFGCKDNIVLF
ncbi:hypothetical protein F4779DRAFT_3346 [Xylariaceae sp. FL0662B]|nr:hypothetical protein F4779DRAFT_3346 [Xylariaceae sp. FL0662B]